MLGLGCWLEVLCWEDGLLCCECVGSLGEQRVVLLPFSNDFAVSIVCLFRSY